MVIRIPETDTSTMNLRIDRLATLYLACPVRRVLAANTASVPILMYHSIADVKNTDTNSYYQTTTAPDVFRCQMEYLHRNSYRTVGLAEAVVQSRKRSGAADRVVVLTFDDGYADFYREAFPVLSQYAFEATVFLPTAYIGDARRTFNGTECLTWAEVRELRNHGVSFGSHTVSHPHLI